MTVPKRPRLAVPVKLADRVWTWRDDIGVLHVKDADPRGAGRPGSWESRYAAACNWCDWTCGPDLVKAAVAEQARWHRDHHRREA